MPPFWRKSPVAWFLELEAQFALAGVTMDAIRFKQALVGLDEETIELTSDKDYSYKKLKEQSRKRLSASVTGT